MFTKKDLFLLVLTLVVVVPNAFANIPSTAYMEDYVATEIGKLPAQPVVNNATLTIQKNGTSVGTFTANQSTNKTINITVPTGALASKDAVTTSEITDGTIATVDIADSAITTAKIKDLNVTTAKIAASAVTSAKIADGTIATVDIADSAITTDKIAADAVTSAKIANGTIVDADIATDAKIAASKISGLATVATSGSYNDLSNKPTLGTLASKSAVTTSEITDGTITNADIATNAAIAASKISGLATVATSGSYNDLLNKPSDYTLPVATTTRLGGVKIGGNIDVTDDGTISVKTGSPSKLGVVKVGQIPSGSEDSTTYATIWVE